MPQPQAVGENLLINQPEKPPTDAELTVRTKATAKGCSEKNLIVY